MPDASFQDARRNELLPPTALPDCQEFVGSIPIRHVAVLDSAVLDSGEIPIRYQISDPGMRSHTESEASRAPPAAVLDCLILMKASDLLDSDDSAKKDPRIEKMLEKDA